MPKKGKRPALLRETENGKEKYCPACKDYHPATEEYFYKDGRSSTGFSSWCIEQTLVKNQKNKKAKAQEAPAENQAAATLVLDFSRHGQMMEKIQAGAEVEFRSPDQHAMWLISQALQQDVRAS